jgi:hypothetical protein
MTQYPTITREEAARLIKSGRLTKASLYEPDHARDGSKFCFVELSPGYKQFYRLRPEEK